MIGIFLRIFAYVVYLIAGLWGVILCWRFLVDAVGVFFALVCFLFFPVVFALVPWLDVFFNGNWLTVQVCWGGWLFATMLFRIADRLDDGG